MAPPTARAMLVLLWEPISWLWSRLLGWLLRLPWFCEREQEREHARIRDESHDEMMKFVNIYWPRPCHAMPCHATCMYVYMYVKQKTKKIKREGMLVKRKSGVNPKSKKREIAKMK
jgi:hypothetical protein